MIRFACPKCKAVLECPDDEAGSKMGCPHCGQRLQIPTPPPNRTILAPYLGRGPDPAARPGVNVPPTAPLPGWMGQASPPPVRQNPVPTPPPGQSGGKDDSGEFVDVKIEVVGDGDVPRRSGRRRSRRGDEEDF